MYALELWIKLMIESACFKVKLDFVLKRADNDNICFLIPGIDDNWELLYYLYS